MASSFAQQTSDSRVKEALKIECFSYLESIGVNPLKESGKYLYYRSPSGGSRGSLIVNKETNRWIDYREDGDWDRVISLVMQYEGVDFLKAIDILVGEGKSYLKKEPIKETEKIISIQLINTNNFFNNYLYSYIKRRKINIYLLRKYCKQITVCFPTSKNPEKPIDFIGFKNDLGGWELRNWSKKRSISPKYFTTIGSEGDKYFFEGFFDFLSYLVLNKIDEINGIAIILNSISLIKWVIPILKSPGLNYLFFDNDKAADKKIKYLEEEKIPFIDMRSTYSLYNDLNKKLMGDLMF